MYKSLTLCGCEAWVYVATPACHVPVVGYTGLYLHKPNIVSETASVPISI